jgi:hypothetical protein
MGSTERGKPGTFRRAAIEWAVRGDRAASAAATELAGDVASVILVEGVSDAVAVEALAERGGRDLERERVCVIPMGGVTNVAKFLNILGPSGLDLSLVGLCDIDRERHLRRALARAGLADARFFVCDADLEDELIRALGTDTLQQILDVEGDLRAFRTFQNQPAQRSRPIDAQLRRFLGTTAGRKERYARILVEALDRVPPPLADLLRSTG